MKVTDRDVVEIRKRYKNTNENYRQIAKYYDVTYQTISNIVNGEKRFKDIEEGPIRGEDYDKKTRRKPKNSKIMNEAVRRIRVSYQNGQKTTSIAKSWNISLQVVWKILSGKMYPEFDGPTFDSINTLSPKTAKKIRRYYQNNKQDTSYEKVGKLYGVSGGYVKKIIYGWVHKDAGGPIKEPDSLNTLCEEEVVKIRNMACNKTYKEISKKFPISKSSVGPIVRGKSWKDVGGPIKGKDY